MRPPARTPSPIFVGVKHGSEALAARGFDRPAGPESVSIWSRQGPASPQVREVGDHPLPKISILHTLLISDVAHTATYGDDVGNSGLHVPQLAEILGPGRGNGPALGGPALEYDVRPAPHGVHTRAELALNHEAFWSNRSTAPAGRDCLGVTSTSRQAPRKTAGPVARVWSGLLSGVSLDACHRSR